MIPEWPIRAEGPRRRTRPGHALGRGHVPARRLADAALDLGLPTGGRVSDRVRASMSAMRDDLVAAIERPLRLTLETEFADEEGIVTSLSSCMDVAVPVLADAGTLAHPPLVAVLLRRAEEFVLAGRLVRERGTGGLPVDDADPNFAVAATALFVAETGRLDRFGEPALLFDDLPAELAVWLVWQVAAAFRQYLCDHQLVEEDRVDVSLTAAATALIARHDEGRGLHAIAARLAARLAAADRIDGALLGTLLEGGQVSAFVASLGAVVSLPSEEVWNIVADPVGGRLATLLRVAGIERSAAASVLLQLMPPGGDPVAETALFDAWDTADAIAALSWVRTPAEYREAVHALDVALAIAHA